MTDIIDQANDVAQQTIERALLNAPKFDRPSRTECEECGEPIPPERQKMDGVIYCIDCQTYMERQKRIFSHGKK